MLKKMIINSKEFIMVTFQPLYNRARIVTRQVRNLLTKILREVGPEIKTLGDFWDLEGSLAHTQTSELTVSYAHYQR